MSKAKATAGAAAPDEQAVIVHTSAQLPAPSNTTGCAGCGNCSGDCAKPQAHQPTPERPRDAYTGVAGTFVRDPITGERRPITPATVEKE